MICAMPKSCASAACIVNMHANAYVPSIMGVMTMSTNTAIAHENGMQLSCKPHALRHTKVDLLSALMAIT